MAAHAIGEVPALGTDIPLPDARPVPADSDRWRAPRGPSGVLLQVSGTSDRAVDGA